MKLRMPKSPVLTAVGVIVTVAAAAVVWQNLPTPTDLYGPFDVHGEAGAPAEGRAVTATVTAVRIAPQVNSIQAAGQFVVVDTTLEADRNTGLPHSELIDMHPPSMSLIGKTLRAEISPGITQRGSWVFEVASALVEPDASDPLTLRVWVGDAFLDSRLVIRIPADDPRVSRTEAVDLEPPVKSVS